MKQLIMLCILSYLLAFTTVTNAQNKNTGNSKSMQGAYLMQRQVINDGKKDSVMNTQQLKIFTDRYMMYAHSLPDDSLGMYGIGTYEIKNGKVIEHVFFTSDSGARNSSFELAITKKNDGYTQVINFNGQGVLTEDYKTVSKNVNTPLDGAWKQVKTEFTSTSGETTVDDHPTQFKVFQSGHFIWANTQTDSASHQLVSNYGYGTFEMMGANRAKEVNMSSTFRTALVNVPVTLELEFMGKDRFKQTIVFPSGSKGTETYERLK
ncbi:hypothetical protein [Flavisolibacter tropicus]|uniref:DUF4412 domain-containing protein n=1 Tax=Flavisolibacter tropicus TaxID=1492898 RepID=A0A172U0M2_9BACT|nr:hypothetical protein [Flavisolibacter tropicus]ANE52664.1 hypothetical protein SY85_21450 [Flavisolibacter tropicus]